MMQTVMDHEDPDLPGSSQPTPTPSKPIGRGRRWFLFKLLMMLVGVLMLAGAVWLIIAQQDKIATALQALSHPSPGIVILLVATMLVSIFVTGVQFQLLLARHQVPFMEMQGLIAGSALLNFLPLKAGLVGRIAYHQVVHAIRPMETARAMILARVAGLFAIALTAGTLSLRYLMNGDDLWAWAMIPIAVPGWLMLFPMTRTAGIVIVLKYADLLLMAVRYQCAFIMMNEPMSFDICMALASIGMLAGAIPFLSGGLGLREWLVGWLTTMLVMLPAALEIGLLADLVNRAVELVVLLPLGGLAILMLRPRLKAAVHRYQSLQEAVINRDRSRDPEP